MAARMGIAQASSIMMTGGVAKNISVVQALERALGCSIDVAPYAQMTGAISAARLAQSTS